MQQINRPRPDIKFQLCGMIEIRTHAAKKMKLEKDSALSFFIDNENNVYIKKDEEGIKPSSSNGYFMRYRSSEVCKKILSLPDVPVGTKEASFRLGEEENNLFPIITRRIL